MVCYLSKCTLGIRNCIMTTGSLSPPYGVPFSTPAEKSEGELCGVHTPAFLLIVALLETSNKHGNAINIDWVPQCVYHRSICCFFSLFFCFSFLMHFFLFFFSLFSFVCYFGYFLLLFFVFIPIRSFFCVNL